jgi:hypothetical protein
MRLIFQVVAVALIIAPAVASSQEEAKLGQKQKAWLVSNFRAGLDCSSVQGGVLSFSGKASFDAGTDGGVEVSAAPSSEGLATVTAVAINTKGTGADRNRAAQPACAAVAPATSAAACNVSGDATSPMVSATVPLSVFGAPASSRYVGTVTIVKRTMPAGESPKGAASKRGYDYYKARSDMASAGAVANPRLTYLATCDSSALSSKGSKPSVATYDLAVAKK